ncbi:MAG: ABC transporter [Proteobacteria bacterium]|nr:ABC transporter [Pseudomonadota bacterium]
MSANRQRNLGTLSLVLLALVFVAAVTANNSLLTGLRIDLTEDNLYTVSPGTRNVLASIVEPINVYLFFSDSETADIAPLRNYANRVREMLEELQSAAGGNLVLHVVDPVPFSEDEDRAAQFGLQPITLGLGQSLYFGLAATNSVGDEEVIEIFNPDRERFLEYELARMIYGLARPDKVVVGVHAGVSMTAGFDPQTQRVTEPWIVYNQAGQLFEMRSLPPGFTEIEEDVDVLWLVHPRSLEDETLYAIDQFVMGGGRALIFVDPFAEVDMAAAMDPAAMAAGSASDLAPLLGGWGVEFSSGEVVADNQYALSVTTGLSMRPVRHLGLLGLDATAIDPEDVITDGLYNINVGTAGHFSVADGSTVELQPLLYSSSNAETLPAIQMQMLTDPEALLDDFAPSGESYILAARLAGPLQSAYPDGPPAEDLPDAEGDLAEDADGADNGSEEPADSESPEALADSEHLASTESANVILVGDVDILSDRLWVQQQNFLGQTLATAFANNGDFLINALDNLSGSADLIGIRARGTYSRPFTRVQALRRQADAQFRQTEQRLQAELTETENRLGELQDARTDQGSLLMSDEQQAEIQRFLDEQVRIRQELRGVQRNLDRSIEQLGTVLQFINIGLVPLLLTAAALAAAVVRRRRTEKKS